MRSPNLYQYTAIGGFTHAKAIFLPPVELGVYFHALRRQQKEPLSIGGSFLYRFRQSFACHSPKMSVVSGSVVSFVPFSV